jgi:quaternary ammonium compound-resistance protein SugE
MAWITLFVAGLLEAAWSLGLPKTQGFRRPLASAIVIALIALSLFLLARAAQTLPIGTAYAVWVGIGALGAAIGGVFLYGEPLAGARALFLGLLIVSIIGLKFTAPR